MAAIYIRSGLRSKTAILVLILAIVVGFLLLPFIMLKLNYVDLTLTQRGLHIRVLREPLRDVLLHAYGKCIRMPMLEVGEHWVSLAEFERAGSVEHPTVLGAGDVFLEGRGVHSGRDIKAFRLGNPH